MGEIQSAILRSKDGAPGLDGIRSTLFKHLDLHHLSHLEKILNAIWNSGFIPPILKQSVLIPIHKPGKPRYSPTAYRPIALTSHLCKILERIINDRLVYHIRNKNLLFKHQFGFIKGYSSLDHLVGLETDIVDGFNQGKHTTAVFLDIEKAFDTVKPKIILDTLAEWNIGGKMYRFIKSFLSERTFRVKANHTFSPIFPQTNGVPQGSCISPTLFLIAINSIDRVIPSSLHLRLFADDIVLYHSDKDHKSSETLLQRSIISLTSWAKNNGWTLSPVKSTCVHFCKKRNCPRISTLSLADCPIPSKEQHKFLGLIFDSRLSWLPHIKSLRDRCAVDTQMLRYLSNSQWGAHRDTLLNIYRAVVRSKLEYGSQCFISAPQSYLKRLDPVQNTAIRWALGAFHTSPIESLLCEAEIAPLASRRELLLLKYANSVYFRRNLSHYRKFFPSPKPTSTPRQTHKDSRSKFHEIQSRVSLVLPPIKEVRTNTPPWLYPAISIDFSLLNKSRNECDRQLLINYFSQIKEEKYADHIFIYTDGSKKQDFVGAAFSSTLGENHYSLPPITGILTAELFAINCAVDLILATNLLKFVIATDSKGALDSLKSVNPRHPLSLSILEKHAAAHNKGKRLFFLWLPSHVGIKGNERADTLAGCPVGSSPAEFSFSVTDLNTYATNIHKKLNQLSWDLMEENKLWEIKKNYYEHPNFEKFSRRNLTMITRLRLGHCKVTHEFLLKHEPPPICPPCNVRLTVKHILLECPSFAAIRRRLDLGTSLKDILSYENIPALLSFLHTADLIFKI